MLKATERIPKAKIGELSLPDQGKLKRWRSWRQSVSEPPRRSKRESETTACIAGQEGVEWISDHLFCLIWLLLRVSATFLTSWHRACEGSPFEEALMEMLRFLPGMGLPSCVRCFYCLAARRIVEFVLGPCLFFELLCGHQAQE